MKRVLLLSAVLLCAFMAPSAETSAQPIDFQVTVDKDKIPMNSAIKLNLNFYGTTKTDAPELPHMDGFTWRYLGPSTRISIVNGRSSSSITHMYILEPLKVGTFTIPAISVKIEGKAYTSNPIQVEVAQGQVGQPPPTVAPQPQGSRQETYEDTIEGLGDRAFVVMEAGKKTAYVGEVIPLMIKLYVASLAIRDIQPPDFAHDGFAVGDFTEPRQYQEMLNGMRYDVVEFNTELYPLRDGELKLGPAEINCNLIVKKKMPRSRWSIFDDNFFGPDVFDDFFGRAEAYPLKLRSIDVTVSVRSLPAANVPAGFDGAVGGYNFYLDANPKEVKVGDPITLKMNISGDGDLKAVKPPQFGFGDDFKTYDPEIKQDGKTKTIEQVVIPKSADVKEIPAVNFSYFDTREGRYKTITRGPIPIKVNPLPKGEELKVFGSPAEDNEAVRRKEVLGRDIIYIKEAIGRLNKKGSLLWTNGFFLAGQLIPILAVVTAFFYQRRKERLETDTRYARRIRAPQKARRNIAGAKRLLGSKEPERFYGAVFKALQEYLGDKFHLPSGGITSNVVTDVLEPRGIDKEIRDKAAECFNNCDTARYSPSGMTKEGMSRTLALLEEIIDRLERVKI